jgi:hypothetical protein
MSSSRIRRFNTLHIHSLLNCKLGVKLPLSVSGADSAIITYLTGMHAGLDCSTAQYPAVVPGFETLEVVAQLFYLPCLILNQTFQICYSLVHVLMFGVHAVFTYLKYFSIQ